MEWPRTSSRRCPVSRRYLSSPETSSFTYKGRAVDVKQVGRELGVRYVLEGSVRKAANRVRITGQPGRYRYLAHIFGPIGFDGGLGDIFDLQDQVTESVVGAIAPAVEKSRDRARQAQADRVSRRLCPLFARSGQALSVW